MPKVTDGSYPLATDIDADDVILVVQDGLVRRATPAVLEAAIGTSEAAVRTAVAEYLVPGPGVTLTPSTDALTLSVGASVGGASDIIWTNTAVGPVIQSPNGSRYRLKVADNGTLTTELISGSGGSGTPGETQPFPNVGVAMGAVVSTPPSTDLTRIAAMGALADRRDYAWSEIQPTSGTLLTDDATWATTLAKVQASLDAGLTPFPMIGYAPAWANGGNADNKYPVASGFEDEWQAFCQAFAARVIPLGVRHFELWNEPNLATFWKPTPSVANYVNRVLIPGATGIRAAATAAGVTVQIITGGTGPAVNGTNIDPRTWVQGLYDNGGKDFFDHIGHHPYTWPYPPDRDDHIPPDSFSPNQWNPMIQTLRIREIMEAEGDANKQVWATEVGAPSRDAAPHWPTAGHDNFVSHATLATRVNEIYDYWFGFNSGDSGGSGGSTIWTDTFNYATGNFLPRTGWESGGGSADSWDVFNDTFEGTPMTVLYSSQDQHVVRDTGQLNHRISCRLKTVNGDGVAGLVAKRVSDSQYLGWEYVKHDGGVGAAPGPEDKMVLYIRDGGNHYEFFTLLSAGIQYNTWYEMALQYVDGHVKAWWDGDLLYDAPLEIAHNAIIASGTKAGPINFAGTTNFDWVTASQPSAGWAGPLMWYQHRNAAAEPLGTNTAGGFGVLYNTGSDKPGGARANLLAKNQAND